MKFKTLMVGLMIAGLAGAAFVEDSKEESPKKNAVTIGFLQGGGGLVGFDYERLLFGGVGIQVGVGYPSVGAGLTFHLDEPTTDSNAIFVGTWNQGMPGSPLSQNYVGASYMMRGWHWLNAQIGLGYLTFIGDELKSQVYGSKDAPKFSLIVSIGWYTGF